MRKPKKVDTITGTSGDFTGNLEDWEERVFRTAVLFRVHRFYGMGATDRAELTNFREALTMCALELRKPGHRVMVYAVADTERWFLIPQDQWLKYLRIWDKEHASPTTR
jgi:hypothetical protein